VPAADCENLGIARTADADYNSLAIELEPASKAGAPSRALVNVVYHSPPRIGRCTHMAANGKNVNWPLGLLGALGGGSLGYFAFGYLVEQGFYAIVLPGALAGIGAGALSGGKSKPLGVVCGLLAIVLGIVTEWRFAPFVADESFSFFVRHLFRQAPQRAQAADPDPDRGGRGVGLLVRRRKGRRRLAPSQRNERITDYEGRLLGLPEDVARSENWPHSNRTRGASASRRPA